MISPYVCHIWCNGQSSVLLLLSPIPKYTTVVIFQWHPYRQHIWLILLIKAVFMAFCMCSLVASWYAFSYSSALDTGRETNISAKLSQRSFLQCFFDVWQYLYFTTMTHYLQIFYSLCRVLCKRCQAFRQAVFTCMNCVMPSKSTLLAQELVLFAAKHHVAGSKCSCGSSILIGEKTPIYRDLCTVKFHPR